uniref:Transcription factor bHLH143-like n=1 Tax=Nelumbo nucifera TaxID=4432 RepID=A0A822Z8S2_NELNU|nr:TPA_asm: hypothetical protein HUJ06_015313 [Nelumbo nucifera]
MGKDYDFWLLHQHSAWQSPNLNCSSIPVDPSQQNTFPSFINPYAYMVSANGALPGFEVSGLPHLKIAQANERHGWFYCLPRYRQAFVPSPNYVSKDKYSADPNGASGDATANVVSGSVEKRLLVIDQSSNKTNLIFGSVVGTSMHHPSTRTPKPEEALTERSPIYNPGPLVSSGLDGNQSSADQSEMQEDTEELNALLYSDDEYEEEDDDDEVTSTGHSPSEMTVYERRDKIEGSTEEVASSAGPAKKRRKLFDAESSRVNRTTGNKRSWEMHHLSGDMQLRKEKIRETVSILQSIIPGGKGKDAMLVLDEAIQYLRSLKLKAQGLGTSTL